MIPAGDYVRDALAVFLLLLPLGMAWDMDHEAVGLSQLIVATLLSILSLALRYLKAASVLPDVMSPARVQAVRLLMNAPYIIAVVTTLVLGYVGEAEEGQAGSGGGVGVGMAVGLAGVLLAAQGRAAEQGEGGSDAALWRGITMVIAVAGLVLGTLSAMINMVEVSDDVAWNGYVVLVLGVVLFTALPLIAARAVVRGDSVWRDVVIVFGVAGLLTAVWAQAAEDTMGEAWSLRLNGPQMLLWPGLGAAAAAAGISAAAPPAAGAVRWINMAGRLFQTVTLVAVIGMLIFGLRLIDEVDARGVHIFSLVLSLIVLVLATFGRNTLIKDARANQPMALGAGCVIVMLALLGAAVMGVADSVEITVDVAAMICMWIVFSAAAGLVLTAPRPIQDEFGLTEDEPPPSEQELGPLTGIDDGKAVGPRRPGTTGDGVHADDESLWSVHTDDHGLRHDHER